MTSTVVDVRRLKVNVNLMFFFLNKKVNLLVSELHIYQYARCKKKSTVVITWNKKGKCIPGKKKRTFTFVSQ